MMDLKENLSSVLSRIKEAQNKSRFNQKVELIAVTKTVESDIINQALSLGVRNIGENKVQEVQRKYPDIKGDVIWHLIGTLQTNKVKYIADKVDMIHSLDRIELAKEINRHAIKNNRIIKCLIQVKISEEDTKHGVEIDNVIPIVREISEIYPNIKICGLMGMAPYFEDKENARSYFIKLRSLFDEVKDLNIPGVEMKHISMGMSGDYEVAIEEGATMVRVGTAIFGERVYL